MANKGTVFQRRFFRVPFRQPVEFTIIKYNSRKITSEPGMGQGQDMGEDGLSFVAELSMPEEMVMRVVFDLPDFGTQRILGRVVRSTEVTGGFLTAVQFINLNGIRKDQFRSFITAATKKQYKFLKRL